MPTPLLPALLPAPQRHVLSNGATLLACPMPQLATATVAVFLRAGSRDEPAELAGISHFLEHMAFKGTRSRTVQAINYAAESLGAEMNAYTDKDATCYYLEGLGAHVPEMLDLLADIVLDSTFPADELEREREVILQECTEYDEDPQQLAFTLLDAALWGTHPMGRPIIGTPKTIAAITRDDVVRYVQQHYGAHRLVIAAAGQLDADAFFAQAERRFGAVPGAGEVPAPTTPPHLGEAKARRLPGVSQTYIDLAWPMPSRADDPHLANLVATLFGGGMSAPLLDTVRERLGLAYSVGATADVGDVHGALVIDAITTPEKVPDFTQALAGLLATQAQAVSAQDLTRAKNQLLVALVRTAERPLRLLQRCVEHRWATGTEFDLRAAADALHAIEAAAVRDAFATMLGHRPATVLVGAGATARNARDLQGKLGAAQG